MESFVRIKSFFNSKSERSIDNLTKIYENSELIYISVKNITAYYRVLSQHLYYPAIIYTFLYTIISSDP